MCKLVLGFVKTLVENYQVCNYKRECSNDDVIITSLLYIYLEAN